MKSLEGQGKIRAPRKLGLEDWGAREEAKKSKAADALGGFLVHQTLGGRKQSPVMGSIKEGRK